MKRSLILSRTSNLSETRHSTWQPDAWCTKENIDLWIRIQSHIGKLGHIRWVKKPRLLESTMMTGLAIQADFKAKEGAEKHGYTSSQKKK
eukprot:2972979-Heterocapsa_arctica.AAC.1